MDIFQTLRGPDDSGVFESKHCLFGHRRLSIIDLSPAGHQPMERGDLVITYNGEIYNFSELKRELESHGIQFKTHTDTEVILALFEKYGPESFSRLRGMFAFGLYDKNAHKLFLVRDRFGIKPLYYTDTQDKIVFASTVGAIKESGLVPLTKNEDAKIAFLLFGSVPLPFTTWKEIEAVPDGCFLEVDAGGNKKFTRYYSSLPYFSGVSESSREYISETAGVLQDSVSAHLVSDAPLGVFLSGGLDSSAIAALAAASREKPVTTLSVTFDEEKFSEKKYQDAVVKRIKSDHRELRVRKTDFFQNLSSALQAMDQPTIDGINTYFISKAAHDAGLKVVLSGLGGDELFLGYRNFRRAKMLKTLSGVPFSRYFAGLGGKYEKFLFLESGSILGFYLVFRGIFPPHEAAKIAGVSEKRVFEFLTKLEERLFGGDRKTLAMMNAVQLLSYLETKLYMQNQLLKDSDFMAMRHSVEIRVPFVDHRVVEYIARIAPEVKLRGLYNKQILIDAVRDKIPAEVYERKKMGFTFPFELWLRELPEFQNATYGHWSKTWMLYILQNW